MSKNDMKNRIYTLSKNDLKVLVKTYRIPPDLHPCLPDPGFTMDRLHGDAIGIYSEFLCFLVFKDKFFLIDRRAIPDYLTWRHYCSCVSDDLPIDGYDHNDVEQLCAHVICLREIKEEVLVHSGLSSVWFNKECDPVFRRIDDNAGRLGVIISIPYLFDANVVEESHHLSLLLLKRVPSHTTVQAVKGAIILLLSPDEIAASLPNSCIAKNSKGPSEARDKGVSTRAVSVPILCLGKRLGAHPSITVVSASEPSHVRTLAPACTSGHSLSLGGVVVSGSGAEVIQYQLDLLDSLARSALAHDAKYDQISNDDFGTHYPWKALDQTITPVELRRTESLLPLELSNHVNILSALLVSHGYELNFCYTNLVSSRARLQEKLNQKKGDVRFLRSEVTSLDNKLEKLQRDYDAVGQETRELCSQRDDAFEEVKNLESQLTDAKVAFIGLMEELTQTDVKLSKQALNMRDLQNELALERLLSSDEFHAALARAASLDINYGTKADFDKALVDFPTTPFPFLGKVAMAVGCTLFDVAQILPDKFARSATLVSTAPSGVNEAPDQVPL
nr:hypothetical protein [Tanacetum cinerariifolium]